MFDARRVQLVLLAIIGVFAVLSSAAIQQQPCTVDKKECVFHFDVEHRLTMMDHKTLTFAENGKLYAYDVTNTSNATAIPMENVISADGYGTPRLVTVVNGQFPGPDIVVYEGQRVIVNVRNLLPNDAVTIHWHGLHQEGTPWMDGVPHVTQCPIHPMHSFRYDFIAKPKGTFWWHSHMGTQRTMGVFGAFIIKERIETDVEDRIMQIQDWNHDHDSDHGHNLCKWCLEDTWGEKNFKGTNNLIRPSIAYFKFSPALLTAEGDFISKITVLHYQHTLFKKGNRVSVDGHSITVIASDGYDIEAEEAESFIINPGELFDFELLADQPVGNYWIRGT